MIRPTLESGAYGIVVVNNQLAVIVFGPPLAEDEARLACALHRTLDRGLLVIV